MKEFRFVILGAGNIAGKFCEAVSYGTCCGCCSSQQESGAGSNFCRKNGVLRPMGTMKKCSGWKNRTGPILR